MEWPSHFPGNCPPSGGKPAQGFVYRFTESAEPTPDDFRSFKELRPEEDFGSKECQSCGVSVFTDLAEVEAMARKIPAYSTKYAAGGILTHELGITLPTPSRERKSHVTWWIPRGVEPWLAFRVISLPEDAPP
jgi:hypothetical protein